MSAPRCRDGSLASLLSQANHALYKDFGAHLHAAGLSPLEWRALAALLDAAPLTISQLASQLQAKQPTVTRLVQRMGEQGWVALRADPADQRRTMVLATAAGKRLVRPLVEQARAYETQTLRSLAASEQAVLKKLLVKLAGHSR